MHYSPMVYSVSPVRLSHLWLVVSVDKWANTLSEPQYLLGLSGWRPAGALDQIRVAE